MTKLYLLAFLLFSGTSIASCPELYPGNNTIKINKTLELCNTSYVVRYDPSIKGTLFSSEKFSPRAKYIERTNDFRPDLRLAPNERAERNDYFHSGFDQGHLTPAGNSRTVKEMSESFLLTNMTPQEPQLNRGAWKELEESVRNTALRANAQVHIITGAIYDDKQVKERTNATIGDNRIPVPLSYYKIVYFDGKVMSAYYAQNKPTAVVQKISMKDLYAKTGIRF